MERFRAIPRELITRQERPVDALEFTDTELLEARGRVDVAGLPELPSRFLQKTVYVSRT